MKIHNDIQNFINQSNTSNIKQRGIGTRPSQFWLVEGFGESEVSQLNAFDNALLDAGIGNLNLIAYSSILPDFIQYQTNPLNIFPGSVTGIIKAQANGKTGDKLEAGIAIAKVQNHFIVFEANGKNIEILLQNQINEAGSMRNIGFDEIFVHTNKSTVNKEYGVCLVCIVFDPSSYV